MLEGLLDDVDDKSSSKCVVGRWQDGLSPEDREIFDAAVSGSAPTYRIYSRLVARRAVTFSNSSFDRHRHGMCRCPR